MGQKFFLLLGSRTFPWDIYARQHFPIVFRRLDGRNFRAVQMSAESQNGPRGFAEIWRDVTFRLNSNRSRQTNDLKKKSKRKTNDLKKNRKTTEILQNFLIWRYQMQFFWLKKKKKTPILTGKFVFLPHSRTLIVFPGPFMYSNRTVHTCGKKRLLLLLFPHPILFFSDLSRFQQWLRQKLFVLLCSHTLRIFRGPFAFSIGTWGKNFPFFFSASARNAKYSRINKL